MSSSVEIPGATVTWLTAEENPAVACLTRRKLLDEPPSAGLDALWAQRNSYTPVARILELMQADGSWDKPSQDYRKYGGSLWQVHFLGELYASSDDERVQRAAAYAFSRQLEDGSWSCNGRPSAAIPCLTANVGRALARLGHARDERLTNALGYCVKLLDTFGCLTCGAIYSQTNDAPKDWGASSSTLNGYCHMLAPKLLLFLAEVPPDNWPEGAERLRKECVRVLRDKQVHRCLPEEAREFFDLFYTAKSSERDGLRERYLAEHPQLHYKDKPGWLRFGYPLSYNSDALEALYALALHDEPMRDEYTPALEVIRAAADGQMRWTLRNTFNDKMLAPVEEKGEPSRWLTYRALRVLRHFDGMAQSA
ncbi:MAG: hypothetical protein JXA36_04890 [Coriobacteriia bacterium]|nr:hypothetical protein [Coriobacteriia bacterium]